MPSPGTGPSKPSAEITLEANPTSVEVDRFKGFRAAGINRVSLGVQSLREKPLAELGRRHTVDEAVAAVRIAQSVFERSSFDLIYARPHQTPGGLGGRAQGGAVAGPGAISRSTSSPSSRARAISTCFKAGKLKMPDEDLAADFYELTQELTAAGRPARL